MQHDINPFKLISIIFEDKQLGLSKDSVKRLSPMQMVLKARSITKLSSYFLGLFPQKPNLSTGRSPLSVTSRKQFSLFHAEKCKQELIPNTLDIYFSTVLV